MLLKMYYRKIYEIYRKIPTYSTEIAGKAVATLAPSICGLGKSVLDDTRASSPCKCLAEIFDERSRRECTAGLRILKIFFT